MEERWKYNREVHKLFIEFKKAYDAVRTEAMYNTVIEFGVIMKLVRPTKMCWNETCNKVRRPQRSLIRMVWN
jgi:hypothetical protein